tara:strand:+ start:2977 stop:3108 length:132 start_codon:yes stop_codon:yes gene_type:complete
MAHESSTQAIPFEYNQIIQELIYLNNGKYYVNNGWNISRNIHK